MQPVEPVQPVVGDHLAWPTRRQARQAPYGVSLRATELLSQSWNALKDDMGRLVGITALPYAFMVVAMIGLVVAGIAMNFDIDHLDESGPLMGLVIGGGGGFVISAWLMMIAAQAGTFLVAEERLRGESRSVGTVGALMQGLGFLGRLCGAYMLMGLVAMVVFSPTMILAGAAVATENVAFGVGAAMFAIPSFLVLWYGSLRVMAAGPAIVAEDLGVIDAIKRSIALTEGKVTDVFVAFLVFGAVMFGVNMMVSIIGIIPLVGVLVQLGFSVAMGAFQSVFMFYVYAALKDAES